MGDKRLAVEMHVSEETVEDLALLDPEGFRETLQKAVREAVAALIEKAKWTTAQINALPDSSFLYIEGGGKKDAEGKTTPRSLRHFPVKDGDGKVDLPHVRNALARIPQSKLPQAVKDKAKAKAEAMLAAAKK